MAYTIIRAKKAILNKWDWSEPNNNINLFIHGPIGIGKTWCVEQAVAQRILYDKELELEQGKDFLLYTYKEKLISDINRLKTFTKPRQIQDLLDQHLLVLRLAESPIEKITGIPCPNFNDKSAIFLMPENFITFAKSKWTVIFLDELDKASEAALTACTHLIESKRIGEFSFPSDTYVIAAANRVTDSYLSKPIPPELRNRAAHIEVMPDLPSWVEWAIPNGIRKDIITFLLYSQRAGKNWLAVYDDQAEANSTSGFATPRTWHMGSDQMNKLERMGASFEDMIQELAEFVGAAAAHDFKIYYELYSKINIFDILNGIKKIPKLIAGSNMNKNILSDQYIHAFAFMNQISVDVLLQNPKYVTNFILAIEDMLPDLKAILMKFIFSDDKLIELISAQTLGMQLISSHLDKMSTVVSKR